MNKAIWADAWWVPVTSGICLILIALLFFFFPVATATGAVWIVGFFWLTGGLFKLAGLFFDQTHWGYKLFGGFLSVVVGSWIVFPSSGADALLNNIAVFSAVALVWGLMGFMVGVTTLLASFRVKNFAEGAVGVLELIFSLIILSSLFSAAMAVPVVYAVFALVAGVASVYAGFSVRKHGKKNIFT